MKSEPTRIDHLRSGTVARSSGWLAAGLIALAALVAYHNSFSGAFVLDDSSSIAGNPSIRHLWPLGGPLSPPHGRGLTVDGRPILNLSLAVNYALGGARVWGYHALNLIIHIVAGLVLFGVVRRTLERIRAAGDPMLLALAVALLWTLHPLQTESVTYVIQRAESLMGLFYLLTLYCFIRLSEPESLLVPLRGTSADGRKGRWAWLSIACCLLGMETKEVMVSAPVIVFLYDTTFVSGGFRDAWRRHWRLYAGLASTWLLLAYVVASAGNRGGTSGIGIGVGAWAYWLTQFPAVVKYVGLALWPNPLVFDYGTEWIPRAGDALPYAAAVIALVAGSGYALLRPGREVPMGARALGFAGAWFLAILAPTSLVPGNRQTMAEHRMYLALAAVIAVGVVVIYRLAGRRSLALFAALAVVFGVLTLRRNADYRSQLVLYQDTADKCPGNAFAQCNLGTELFSKGRTYEAIDRYETALRLRPDYPVAEDNLGNALARLGHFDEAAGHYLAAIRLDPAFANAHSNLGVALYQLGRVADATAQFRTALRLDPDDAEAHNNLGTALVRMGRVDEAISCYREAVRLSPDYASAHCNLGNALLRKGAIEEATRHYEEALRLQPDFPEARRMLDQVRAGLGGTARP